MNTDVEGQDNRHQPAQGRRLWLSVLLPFALPLAVVVGYIGAALSLRSRAQFAVVTDSMLTALVLFPLAVCMFPITILCLALVVLTGRLSFRARSPLRRLERLTARIESNADHWLGRIDSRVLEWAVKLAPLRQILQLFDAPETDSDEEAAQ